MPLNTKLLFVKFDGSSPTQIEQGCAVPVSLFIFPSVTASSQVTVDRGSWPGWLKVYGSVESKVSGVQPVGSSHRYIVKVTLRWQRGRQSRCRPRRWSGR